MIQIKDLITAKEIEVLLDQYLNSKLSTQGSNMFIGTVVDNNDPERMGRVKVNIIDKYEGIQTSDLPWCRPEVTNVSGHFSIPNINDKLIVRVDDIYNPVYLGKLLNSLNKSSLLEEEYPNTNVIYEDETGTSITVNKKVNSMLITHSSGSSIEFKESGDIDITSNGNFTIKTSKGKINLNDNLISEGFGISRLLLGGENAVIPAPNLPATPPPGLPLAPAQMKVFIT